MTDDNGNTRPHPAGADEETELLNISNHSNGKSEETMQKTYEDTEDNEWKEQDHDDIQSSTVSWGNHCKRKTSYAAHTKASVAKKNEKVELPPWVKRTQTYKEPPSRPDSPMNRPASAMDSRRSSPRRCSTTGKKREHGMLDRRSPPLGISSPRKNRRTRSRSLTAADIVHVYHCRPITLKASALEEKEEGSSVQVEELETDVQHKEHKPTADLATSKVILDRVVAEKEALGAKLRATEKERNSTAERLGTAKQELQTLKGDEEKLKQEHNQLLDRYKELQAHMEADSFGEPRLPQEGLVESGVKDLGVKVDELEKQIAETQWVLQKKEKELVEERKHVEGVEDELIEANEALKKERMHKDALSKIIDVISDAMSQGTNTKLRMLNNLARKLAAHPDTEDLPLKFLQLLSQFITNKESLERQLADKDHEIEIREKAMRANEDETGMMSPLKSPRQADRDAFEKLFREERRKRKAAEGALEKIQTSAEKDYLSQLEQKTEELIKAQEETATLRKQVHHLETQAKAWQEESEDAKSQLEKRALAFEETIARQKQESLTYIREYHTKTQDPTHWQVQGLQQKLADLEQDLTTTTKLFNDTKRQKAHLEDATKELAETNILQMNHIDQIQQAYMRGAKLPTLAPPPMPYDEEEQDPNGEPPALNPPWPMAAQKEPRIPACHLPAAIERRAALVAAYREELAQARQKEFIALTKTAPLLIHNANVERDDEIMEKVRKWKLGDLYPPGKEGYEAIRGKSAWERWEGPRWAKEKASWAEKKVLVDKGLWIGD
ncbi:hypothetical protein BDW02DRAFT_645275 [Decorospora gaudefroyi]|uniref:Uncharacterized protein n=1 Tax=Decorospora gaudefroyi TaxID=184978 RepID=A0A6A5KNS1_9PLEO|nr:hypothetical protein BDW02DRAFT_645275 [Decorospora gaudefroyi]